VIERLADSIDVVEVHSGRANREANRRAEELCAILGAAPGAGSDPHTLDEIGAVYIEMENFDGPNDFVASLRRGSIVRNPPRWRLWVEARLTPGCPRR
jgi:hypothetical protein